MLRASDTLDITRRMEIPHMLVGQAKAVVLRIEGIFYIADHPRGVASQLEVTIHS